MKRILGALLAVICCLSAFSGCFPKKHEESWENETSIKIMQYDWDGGGVSSKTVSDNEVADALINALKNMEQTEETVEKLSDEDFDFTGSMKSVERGTMWLEVGSKIYRLNSDRTQLCRVKTYLGNGYVMNMDEEFWNLLSRTWYYYPYDFYSGTYYPGTGELTLDHDYEAESAVGISIKSIYVEKKDEPQNMITIELLSTVDQSFRLDFYCQQSNDNIANEDRIDIDLTKGVPKTLEIPFGGWKDFSYWITICMDNTRVKVWIKP